MQVAVRGVRESTAFQGFVSAADVVSEINAGSEARSLTRAANG